MAEPKLLAQITVPTGGWDFTGDDGPNFTGTIPAGDYDSILELASALQTALNAASTNVTLTIAVSATGIVTITGDIAWNVVWASTDDDLSTLLGFLETETVNGSPPYTLTASRRHRRAFYSPVGADYDLDRRRIPSREQESEDGGLIQFASSQEHRYRRVAFHLLSPEATSEGGTASDGYGSTVNWSNVTLYDFWSYTADRPFRFYADRTTGTVAAPGTEGTEYVTCRRMGDSWAPIKVDASDWAYWRAELELKVTGE